MLQVTRSESLSSEWMVSRVAVTLALSTAMIVSNLLIVARRVKTPLVRITETIYGKYQEPKKRGRGDAEIGRGDRKVWKDGVALPGTC